jgi:hypothetical protein
VVSDDADHTKHHFIRSQLNCGIRNGIFLLLVTVAARCNIFTVFDHSNPGSDPPPKESYQFCVTFLLSEVT